MLINGIELSSLGVKLYDRIISSNSVDTYQDWLDGDIQPTDIRQQDRFKSMTLKFLVLCSNEEEAYLKISKLTAMLKKATVRFDDLNLDFSISMSGASDSERLKNGNFIVSYNFTCDYAKGAREIYTTNANITNSFKLTVLYYKDSTTLLSTESITIRAVDFEEPDVSLGSIGINLNKYLPDYYNQGVPTNLGTMDLTYENLLNLKALIINYSPISYNIDVHYYINNGTGYYNEILNRTTTFTYPQVSKATSIGQIIDAKTYKPEGYKSKIDFNKELTVENLLLSSPISVFYDLIQNELSKNVVVNYLTENDEGGFDVYNTSILNFKESDFVEGMTLGEVINIESHRPEGVYYNSGYFEGHNSDDLITYEALESTYEVKYTRATNTIFVEYYVGTYPNWYRMTTTTLTTKYKDSYVEDFDVIRDLNLDLNKYHTAVYEEGVLYNQDVYDSYESVLNAGVLQIYYKEINYPIVVRYYSGDLGNLIAEETIEINDLMFLNNPILSDIIPITAHRPEGYQFNEFYSYDGEVSLSALTQASPITILYEEIVELKTKNIIVRYKQELASAYSTINTSIITINEADYVGGLRLKDIINLNLYQPEFYEAGIIDGASSTALMTFDQVGSSYDVLYVASSYLTSVRYYIDEISDLKWIGSSTISYRVIDFTTTTTLYDLGLNLNAFKPNYAGDGILQYTGPVNFAALRELDAVNVLYESEKEPEDDSGIDYPHRFLFLQHNDLGSYEYLHPEWTMNHAFINTGVSVNDMSKLTVIVEAERVDSNVPLHEVNEGYAYLFGSSSALGNFYMRFNNQTQYGTNLSGVNTYEARAGRYSNTLTQTEDAAIGFSANSGIYASAQDGYSRAVFTYSNNLPTDGAQMPYPLYLFANNNNGVYEDGLAGIGIYSCRIYYEDQLVRDMIPVQFYDKIGDQVAPSNCLYDKVSKTFFEDATGLNSFNIRDDERYEDENLEHKIGNCYVNYLKGDEIFQTVAIWFRGNDFENGWDVYENFMVDKYQPAYYNPGVVQVADNFVATFDSLNNQIFNVVYTEQANQIEVNYYREDSDGNRTLLKQEFIPISEADFYQVPTFGDIVRLNKYKPDGYETDFVYEGKRVSLARVLELSPYSIVYKPMAEEPIEYTIILRYIKKIFGLRNYEVVGTKIITFDQSNFRDGEYIDFYIDFNEMKPQYYLDGESYEWYKMDERLTTPEDLKEVYTIYYAPEEQFVDVNYYTDEVAEENLIASTSWGFAIDSYEYPIQLVDTLPNEYINQYKPVRCAGGQLVDPSAWYSFEDLINLPEISIFYESLVEPDDPESVSYEQKVLYWDVAHNGVPLEPFELGTLDGVGHVAGVIPYIDLGYKPKEIGRLRVEAKVHSMGLGYVPGRLENEGFEHRFGGSYSGQSLCYTGFFGYMGADTIVAGQKDSFVEGIGRSNFSPSSKGAFALGARIPRVSGWVYTAEGPQFYDGNTWYAGNSAPGVMVGSPISPYTGIWGEFRRGIAKTEDDNYETIDAFKEYGIYERLRWNEGWLSCLGRTGQMGEEVNEATGGAWLGNPYNITLDAYNNYGELYNTVNSNTPYQVIFAQNDNDIFELREQPKGSLSLFQTTNPTTGKVNIMPFCPVGYPAIGPVGTPIGLQGSALGNPYEITDGSYGSIITETMVMTGTDVAGNPIYETKIQSKNIQYAKFPMPFYPQMSCCYIWSIKIWDRDRLVRDLIPVAKGDKIFDYVMPDNGLFDLITEIFFGNKNFGGKYEMEHSFLDANTGEMKIGTMVREIMPSEVLPLRIMYDPTIYGKITNNYYDYDNTFINNQFVNVPTWYNSNNEQLETILQFNDYKPDDFHLDGMIDLDADLSFEKMTLKELYDMGLANIYYKLRTFTKTVVYYQGNSRVGSKDIFYSLEDIDKAETLADLGIDVELYGSDEFAPGRVVFDESILASDDIAAFIDAPSPIVVYDKLTKEEAPNLLYVEYYRGGAYDDNLITTDEENPNYLDCDLDGVVLNPNGAIKYYNHYHTALYEDEDFGYFIPYQVKVVNKYAGIHRGPARRYQTLAMIIVEDTYTIIEERNGWGRLKEYPVGWVMLSATEPMTGPGQNPDYDIPTTEETATIPFGEHVHITKLTIDRLWCYVPEVESWIKAEDISYDQAGKLYNALGINVINLDNIDFAALTNPSLDKIGIYPEAKVLRFHDYSNYVYDGEYTYEAFSNLHNLEFVYPETIYNYTCVYYKDTPFPYRKGVGKGTVPYSDAGKIKQIALREGPAASTTQKASLSSGYILKLMSAAIDSTDGDGTQWYQVEANQYDTSYHPGNIYTGYVRADLVDVILEPEADQTEESSELGRAAFSCSISDWNPDWDVFIETSWRVDEEGNAINPTIYRDTDLTLSWDYFGFDKNLFRPTGYPDGIYLWNPRSWDSENVMFSFEEMIRTGSQYVLYPTIGVGTYKIATFNNVLATSTEDFANTTVDRTYLLKNEGLALPMDTPNHTTFFYHEENPDELALDVHIEIETKDIIEQESLWDSGASSILDGSVNPNTSKHKASLNVLEGYPTSGSYSGFYNGPGFIFGGTSVYYGSAAEEFLNNNLKPGEALTINLSNYRQSPSSVIGIGNVYNGKPNSYYIITDFNWDEDKPYQKSETYQTSAPLKIDRNTNIKKYRRLEKERPYYATSNDNVGTYPRRFDGAPLTVRPLKTGRGGNQFTNVSGITYGVKVFEQFLLRRYWIPVPKGLWYNFNGRDLRIPENGFYDIITGEFKGQYDVKEAYESWIDDLPGSNSYDRYIITERCANEIFLKNKPVKADEAYNYFDDWYFVAEDVDYIIQVNNDITTYEKPDIYATKVRELTNGLIMPVSKVSSDADNRVVGEWYYSADQWLDTSNTSIYAGDFDKLKLTKLQQSICLLPEVSPKSFYVYLDPSKVAAAGEASDYSYGTSENVLVSHYYYINANNEKFYFDGAFWIPEKYTSNNITESNKNYAISNNTPYYSVPIASNLYKLGTYLYGERITVPYVATNNPNWAYTGRGWIELLGNTSEVL